jgi:hypothetical protein
LLIDREMQGASLDQTIGPRVMRSECCWTFFSWLPSTQVVGFAQVARISSIAVAWTEVVVRVMLSPA